MFFVDSYLIYVIDTYEWCVSIWTKIEEIEKIRETFDSRKKNYIHNFFNDGQQTGVQL